MMYFVYVLKLKNESLYIGYTGDLKRRIKEHNSKESNYTKKYLPAELIYYEAYKNKLNALRREKNLKQYKSAYGHLIKRIRL